MTPILEMKAIVKRFPGVLALQNAQIEVVPGEVHVLVGENGAGKSTLMKIVSGVYTLDGGEMFFKGKPARFTTPKKAREAGIVTIYQELNLIPQLTVTENIFLGDELTRGPLVDWGAMNRRARELLMRLHLAIDPRTKVANLGVAQQQMVEVAKALHERSDLIIMDEPTSALSIPEVQDLFAIIRQLKAEGVAIIYISHHLDEAFEIGDRVTVMRDGKHIITTETRELNVNRLISLMVGRDLSEQFPKERAPRGRELLRVENLTRGKALQSISFTAYAGEVLGIAGLVGAGRTELVRAIFGADLIDSGAIFIEGQRVHIGEPIDAIRCGVGLLTEDRKQQGLVLKFNVRENTSLGVLRNLTGGLFTNRQREAGLAAEYIKRIGIKTSSQDQLVVNLSGGNQQKVVLSKWLATKPKVLIFDEPTRGIDVGAKVEIYRLMNELAAQGVAILMISSEMPEVIGMSDRIMVIAQGRVAGILDHTEATQENILELATGTAPVAV